MIAHDSWRSNESVFQPSSTIMHRLIGTLLRTISCVISARTLTTWQFLYETKPARKIKGHFLLKEHGDLSFFLHNFDEIIIFFDLNEF